MPRRKPTPAYIANHIRRVLKDGGSAPHSEEVRWYFKEEIKSRGWYTAELRKVAVRFRRTILKELGLPFLLQVADELFTGQVLEEKVFAVFLLEKLIDEFEDAEFRLFESWLSRISSWADHDAVVHCLIAPMVVIDPERTRYIFRWANLAFTGTVARRASPWFAAHARRCSSLRSSSYRTCFWPTKTIWYRKGWVGFCVKQ